MDSTFYICFVCTFFLLPIEYDIQYVFEQILFFDRAEIDTEKVGWKLNEWGEW